MADIKQQLGIVPLSAKAEIEAAASTLRTKYTAELRVKAIKLARRKQMHLVIANLKKDHQEYDWKAETISRWKREAKQLTDAELDALSAQPEKQRGRKRYLSKQEEEKALEFALATREKGNRITAKHMAAAARGVVAENNPELLESRGGSRKMCRQFGRRILQANGWAKCGATTDRISTDTEVKRSAPPFFTAIAEANTLPENTYNMNEFFVLLDGDTKKWTWHPKNDKSIVALRDVKLGFTCSVLTSADGAIHLAQMIWKGSTERVHALFTDEAENKMILQDHQPESHFQNGDTWKRWCERFVQIANGRANNNPVCLIIDEAPQHETTALREHGICVVNVPAKKTHYFQPADQLIISNIKQKMTAAWDTYIEEMVSKHGGKQAVEKMFTTNTPMLRARKYLFLARALSTVGPRSVIKSWHQTGIMTYAFNVPTPPHKKDWVPMVARNGGFSMEPDAFIDLGSDSDEEQEEATTNYESDSDVEEIATMQEAGRSAVPAVVGPATIESQVEQALKTRETKTARAARERRERKQAKQKANDDQARQTDEEKKKQADYWRAIATRGSKRDRDDTDEQ